MGVYINMEMPKNCAACRIGHRDTGWDNEDNECEIVFCPIINQGSCLEDAEAKKHRLCPLVPVPPHGRLGDLDVLEQMFSDIDNAPYSGFDGEEPFYSAEDAARIIRLAPSIIPAEEGT